MTITEFLTARLDEDEAVARAAMEGPSRWRTKQERSSFQIDPGPGSQGWDFGGGSGMWQCDDPEDGCDEYTSRAFREAEHITRFDPARVLADVAAKRAIVVLHPPVRLRDLPGSGHTSDAVVCAYDSGPDDVSDASTAYPCITLRLLAQPYAEHPDFDPSWTPTH